MKSENATTTWWRPLKLRLLILYGVMSFVLLSISALGQIRLYNEVGKTFGGFLWASDADQQVVFVAMITGQAACAVAPSSLSINAKITSVNGEDPSAISRLYRQVGPGQSITYIVEANGQHSTCTYRSALFTLDMWQQYYGLAFLAGCCWLLVAGILLATAREWSSAVEGLTLLPVAMLFLLYSHWGNVQSAYPMDAIAQLLWFPAFALLGAAFIHLSLNYRPSVIGMGRQPSFRVDLLPYLPVILIECVFIGLYLLYGHVPTRLEAILSLGYGVCGGLLSLFIGLASLVRIGLRRTQARAALRKQLGDLLGLWMSGIGLGFGLGVLPVLLKGNTLLPLPVFCLLGAVYPLILLYAVRSLRLIGQLQQSMERTEEAMHQQQRTAEELRQANVELQRATSLLLHADAHLRSLISERIHDQPKQQALRIRSLLKHWQHKLQVESADDPALHSFAQPVIAALGKVRAISEELEGDLRGLQLLVEDAYQRRSLGLKLHLTKLVREDLPALHPEASLKIEADLAVLNELSPDLEERPQGATFAEAVSYTITQALLNVYNHAEATCVSVRATCSHGKLEVVIRDDGRGFDPGQVSPAKTSMFKAELKAREAGGTLLIRSTPVPQAEHGTTLILTLPLPADAELL